MSKSQNEYEGALNIPLKARDKNRFKDSSKEGHKVMNHLRIGAEPEPDPTYDEAMKSL